MFGSWLCRGTAAVGAILRLPLRAAQPSGPAARVESGRERSSAALEVFAARTAVRGCVCAN